MSLVQLFIQNDAAHDTLHELGNVGILQFKDLNSEKSAFQRLFVQVLNVIDFLVHFAFGAFCHDFAFLVSSMHTHAPNEQLVSYLSHHFLCAGYFVRGHWNASFFHHFRGALQRLQSSNHDCVRNCWCADLQDVRKCDDMLRILRFLSDLLNKGKADVQEHGDKAQAPSSLHELHEKLTDLEKEMKVWRHHSFW